MNPETKAKSKKGVDENTDDAHDEEDDEFGGFKQPSRLSKFARKVLNNKHSDNHDDNQTSEERKDTADNDLDVEEEEEEDAKEESSSHSKKKKKKRQRDHDTNSDNNNNEDDNNKKQKQHSNADNESDEKANNLAGQVCRQWLKYHYLKIGQSCNPDICQRKHLVTGKPESLYSDFSFKGLKAKHQKTILDAVRKERAQPSNN